VGRNHMSTQNLSLQHQLQKNNGSSAGHIVVVDDEDAVRHTLSLILTHAGYQVTGFSDGFAFIKDKSLKPDCVVLDLSMPGLSGLELLSQLNAPHYPAPVLIVSGKGDIALAVRAMKAGAADFIEKPIRRDEFLARIMAAISAFSAPKQRAPDPQSPPEDRTRPFHFPGCPPLTLREADALAIFIKGDSNKEAARKLGLSPRTVEQHRANIMKKLGAKRSADLIRIVLTQMQAGYDG